MVMRAGLWLMEHERICVVVLSTVAQQKHLLVLSCERQYIETRRRTTPAQTEPKPSSAVDAK